MQLPNIKRNHILIAAGVAVAFGVGATSGYLFAEKRLRDELNDKINAELDEVKEYYSKKYKAGEYATPETALQASANVIVEQEKYWPTEEMVGDEAKPMRVDEPTEEEAEKTEIVRNVFIEPPADRTTRELEYEGWDYETERKRRKGKDIYIITQEEFFTNEPDHEQATLTWYEGDGVLADEADAPIDDISQIVGTEHNLKFGYGTSDKNSVHIRNESLKHDVEVVRSHGKFAEEVYGFIQHSDDGHRKPPKARWDDE